MSKLRKSNAYTATLILLLGIGMVLHIKFPVFTICVTSNSMFPTIEKGDRIICLKKTPELKFKRGQIVVFTDTQDTSQLLVKRLIGLPREQIKVYKNKVYINGLAVPEHYLLQSGIDYTLSPETIPDGKVFVLGDNRNNSSDSATWGPIDFKRVQGKVFFRYWPLKKIGSASFNPQKRTG